MKNQPFFSIIVPLYNCEELTEALVQGLNIQTDKDFEVIFVNDGSTDNTLSELNKNLETASFSYKVHTQENSGPGEARNNGIKMASGKYILFVDCDDSLEFDAVETLSESARNTEADVLVFGYYQDFYIDQNTIDHSIQVVPQKAFFEGNKNIASQTPVLDRKKVFSFACNKAVKRQIILENNIRFSKLMHSEDYFFYIDVFSYINSLEVINKPLYHYVKSPRETLTNQPYIKDFYNLIRKRYSAMQNLLKKADCYSGEAAESAANVHIKHIFSHFSNNCSEYSGMSGRAIRRDISVVFADDLTKEALSLSKGYSKAEKIMNTILHSKNVWLCYFFAKVVKTLRNSKTFDKLK